MKAYLNSEMTGTRHNEIVGENLLENETPIQILEKAGFEKEAVGFRICFGEASHNITSTSALRKYVYKEGKQHEYEE